MPVTADRNGKNYTLGRGELRFSPFTAAQVAAGIGSSTKASGELYFGNTPAVTMTSSEDNLDHFDSDHGIKTKDDSVSLQFDRTGSFTCDNIKKENLALLFLSDDGAGVVTQVSATAATYLTGAVLQGRAYQVGETSVLPTGVRGISNVIVKKGVSWVTTVVATDNYQVDEALGQIYILPGAPGIPDDTELQITYDLEAGTYDQIISGSTAIYGALHFVADNPKGQNFDYLWPYVKVSPDGDFSLKGDDWQTMSYTFEALKKGTLQACYVTSRLAAP